MKKFSAVFIGIITLTLLLTTATVQTSAAQNTEPHYTKSELNFRISKDLTLHAQLDFTVVNPPNSDSGWNYSKSYIVSTSNIFDIKLQSKPKNSVDLQINKKADHSILEINYVIRPGEEINYSLSYKAKGLINEDGPRLRLNSRLGGIDLGSGDWPRDNYQVNLEGPAGAELFTYGPEDVRVSGGNLYFSEELVSPASFQGVMGTWFRSPAYYEVILNETLSNQNSEDEARGVSYNVLLYNGEDNWRFPALVGASPELDTLYLAEEEENNWWGNLEFGTIKPGEDKSSQIKLIHEIKVYNPDIGKSDVGKISNLPDKFEPFLKPRKFWEVENPTLQAVAKTVTDNEKNAYIIAKKIVKFVNERLNYEIQQERLGALTAYQNQMGDCSEYTDLSITLARASGLPARASYGWGYSENKLVGHAWPEFYFPGVGWQPADPTWIDTGGRIESGGVRPGLSFRLGKTDVFAPAGSRSIESYFGRLDSIHILRNKSWLDSSESHGRYFYNGTPPDISENVEVKVLSEDEAAERFLQAARLSENRASELLGDKNDDLGSELASAKEYLEKAEGSENSGRIIVFCKMSISHSSEVIASESKLPRSERWVFPFFEVPIPVFAYLGGMVLLIIVGLFYGLRAK